MSVQQSNPQREWLTCAETAKIVRQRLREHFPGIKFSVRSDTYSGGASIRVSWTDGPASSDVERVVKVLEGSGFDGMIDLKYSMDHYLLPNGTIIFGGTTGTEGSMGSHPAIREPLPPGARRVRLGADFIFCSRSISDYEAKVPAVTAVLAARGHTGYDLENRAHRIVRDQRPGESLDDAESRIIYHNDPRDRIALEEAEHIAAKLW